MNTFLSFCIIFGLAFIVVLTMIALATFIGPKKVSDAKNQPFECGMQPISIQKSFFSVKFYTIAQLFVIFDIELIFLFPWAVRFKKLGMLGLFEMGLFLLIVILGLIYAWKEGLLEWD